MLGSRSGWCRRLIMFMATALALWMYPILATASDKISDPKAWSDDFVRVVTTRNADDVMAALLEATKGSKTADGLKVEIAQLLQALPRLGEALSTDLIARKEWGKSIVMYWYYVDFKEKPMIVSLRFQKRGPNWQLNQFNFNTDLDNAKLP